MKSLTSSFPAKVTAIFLSLLLCYGMALSAIDLLAAYNYGILTEGVASYYETDACLYRMQNDARRLYRLLLEYPSNPPAPAGSTEYETEYESEYEIKYELTGADQQKSAATLDARQLVTLDHPADGYYYLLDGWYEDETNFRFAAYNPTDGSVYANDKAMVFQLTQKLFQETQGLTLWENLCLLYENLLWQNEQEPLTPDAAPGTIRYYTFDNYVLCVGVAPASDTDGSLPVRDAYTQGFRLFHLVSATYVAAAVVLLLCLPCFAADIIFLCCAAGRRRGREEPVLNYQDRIPLDLYLAAAAFGWSACIGLTDSFWTGQLYTVAIVAMLLSGAYLLMLATLLTLCARVKVGKWWRNTVCYQLCRLCWRICRGVVRWGFRLVNTLALTWRVALICGALMLFNLFCIATRMDDGFSMTLYFGVYGAVSLAVCSVARQFQQLKQAGAALASGVLGQEIDTARLYGDLRVHGEHLNSLNQGMTIALDQKMRSERLKTELITNVSHDIKTPLTSIINYVDLLQKTDDPEQRQQYLTVLDRQAQRLKKLTEDLVEASKASTGNLPVSLLPTNLQEIIDQAIGEYEDRLIAAQLEVVVTVPQSGLSAMADGRLLWRVLDNLLNNACKYAQRGTRVYLDACARGSLAVISMKNISHKQLNLSPDELMERFVRGDSSRNTEGSGLGLNIAKSLVELQKGHFTLAIDGDLFKAMISLPLYQPEEFLETERTVTLHE